MRLKLRLLKAEYDPQVLEKILTATWKTLDKGTFINWLDLSRTCTLENFWLDSIPKNVMKVIFWSILYNKVLRRFPKPKFRVEDRVGIFKYEHFFSKNFRLQLLHEAFKTFAIPSREKTQRQKQNKDELDETA